MRLHRNVVVSAAVSVCAAALTYVALRAALWSTPPWSMAQSYSLPQMEKDYPIWFVQGRNELFAWSAPLFCLSSALAGVYLVRLFSLGGAGVSRVAALSASWPAAVFPLVGYFEPFAVLFIGVAILAAALVLVQFVRKRVASSELWTLIVNGIWSVLLFVFSSEWFGVYGD